MYNDAQQTMLVAKLDQAADLLATVATYKVFTPEEEKILFECLVRVKNLAKGLHQ